MDLAVIHILKCFFFSHDECMYDDREPKFTVLSRNGRNSAIKNIVLCSLVYFEVLKQHCIFLLQHYKAYFYLLLHNQIILKVGNLEFLKWNQTLLWILKHCVQNRERERPTACVWWCQAVSKINVSSSREINRYHSSHQMIFPTLICPHWIPVERNHIFAYINAVWWDKKNWQNRVIGKGYEVPM